MATLEERLTAVEHEQAELKHDNAELKHDNAEFKHTNAELKQTNAELKQKIELQTIALGALVNKAMLEKLNEKNDKVFDALIAHDQFTNAQLAELRDYQIELDGKFVGLQTETHQGFAELDGKVVGLQTEMRQRFEHLEALLTQVIARLPQQP